MSNVVHHQFIWRRGGDSVQVTGSFRGWKDGVPMQKLADGSYGEIDFLALYNSFIGCQLCRSGLSHSICC